MSTREIAKEKCPEYDERNPMCRACSTIIRIAEYKKFIQKELGE